MACYTPLFGYRAPGGGMQFHSAGSSSLRPIPLRCGRCIGCRIDRAREWALRCVHESQLHTRNCFITLTYSPEQVPANGSLEVRHWQLFAKRLRKAGDKFRFLHCGEYGDTTWRPHYHACLFGTDFHSDAVLLQRKSSGDIYTSKRLESIWGHGNVSFGELTYDSAAYVARYVLTKLGDEVSTEKYRRIDLATGEEYYVRPPYTTMSRRPGIGAGWYDKYKTDVFPSDEVIHNGRKYPVPQFYNRRHKEESPDFHDYVLRARGKRIDRWNGTPDRLAVREEIAVRRQASRAREPQP